MKTPSSETKRVVMMRRTEVSKLQLSITVCFNLWSQFPHIAVCASDGNSYPSTCHMMTESRGDMLPRVRHAGMCEDEGTDEMRMMKMVRE